MSAWRVRSKRPVRAVGGLVARGLIFLIELYRHTVSPLRLPTCRFMPTCSQYAVEALSEHGLVRGSGLTVIRLAKCGPWHPGGWDPIPGFDDEPGDGPETGTDATDIRSGSFV